MPVYVVPALLPEVHEHDGRLRVLWVIRDHEGNHVNCNNRQQAFIMIQDEIVFYLEKTG
jgi:hypothetical protein